MSQGIDYKVVLSDLENRRSEFNRAIDSAIASIRRMLELTVGIGSVIPATPAPMSVSAPLFLTAKDIDKPFKDMSLGAASMKQIAVVGHGLTNQEIAAALDKAGFVHGSSNFPNLIGTALRRVAQKKGTVVRKGRRWFLAEGHQQAS